jgi:hypothetical protein
MAPAPVVPEAGLSVGLILLALACVTLLALNKMWSLTFGAMLVTMANVFDSLSFKIPVVNYHIGFGFVGNALKTIDNYVLQAIGTGIVQSEKGLHALVGWLTWLLQETADQVAGLAEDTAKAFDQMKRYLIPGLIGVALGPWLPVLQYLRSHLAQLIHAPTTIIHKTTQVIAPGLKALEGEVKALEAKVAAIGAAAPAIILSPPVTLPSPTVIPGVGAIYRGIDSLWREVKRLGKVLTPAGIVGLVAASVFSLAHLGWLRCGNVNKVGKRICGLNSDVLDGLLAGLLVIFGTLSLEAFAKDVQNVTEDFSQAIRGFWRADKLPSGHNPGLGETGL